MPDDNSYDLASLVLAPDEPTFQERAKALSDALRGQRSKADQYSQLGLLSSLTGDSVLGNFGHAALGYGQQQRQLAQHGDEKLLQVPDIRARADLHAAQAKKAAQEEADLNDPATAAAARMLVREAMPDLDVSQTPARPLLTRIAPIARDLSRSREAAQARRDVAAQDQFKAMTDPFGRTVGVLNTKTGQIQRLGGGAAAPGAPADAGAPAATAPTSRVDASSVGMTQESLDQAAEMYHRTGAPPPVARGKAAGLIMTAIQNRAAELHPAADLAGNKAGYKADTGSLAKLQIQADSIDAFENTALKNLDNFLSVAKGISDTGMPILNKPIRKAADLLAGSPQQAQFNAARQVAVQEISKVLSGAVGSGAISDSQRHEVEGLMRGDATIEQLTAVANTLKQDMANRKGAVAEQISKIRGRAAGAGTKKKKYNPVTGTIE